MFFSIWVQEAVFSATIQDKTLITKCVNRSNYLKKYSAIILILQLAYHFINDKDFLGQYGFDEQLANIFEELAIDSYLGLIGFKIYN